MMAACWVDDSVEKMGHPKAAARAVSKVDHWVHPSAVSMAASTVVHLGLLKVALSVDLTAAQMAAHSAPR
jgi:hypothetical protein